MSGIHPRSVVPLRYWSTSDRRIGTSRLPSTGNAWQHPTEGFQSWGESPACLITYQNPAVRERRISSSGRTRLWRFAGLWVFCGEARKCRHLWKSVVHRICPRFSVERYAIRSRDKSILSSGLFISPVKISNSRPVTIMATATATYSWHLIP